MVTIHRKVMFATVILGIKFLPGMNTISDAEYTRLKKDPRKILDEEIQCGNMLMNEKVESPTSDAAKEGIDIKERAAKMAEEIAGVSVKKAIPIIAKMGDGYVLRAIKKSDGRRGVVEAVDRRLESINKQEGSDLTPSSKEAPLGDGSDFLDNVGSGKADKEGRKKHTAIPAMKNE